MMKMSPSINTPRRRATHMPARSARVTHELERGARVSRGGFWRVRRGRSVSEVTPRGRGGFGKERARRVGLAFCERASGAAAAVRKEGTRRRALFGVVAARGRKGGRRRVKWFGQHEGLGAHQLLRSHGIFLQNLARAWPSGLRCQSFIARVSRRAGGAVDAPEAEGFGLRFALHSV